MSTDSELFDVKSPGWHTDVATGGIFGVATYNIEENQVYDMWPQVGETDRQTDGKEIAQFVAEDAWSPARSASFLSVVP